MTPVRPPAREELELLLRIRQHEQQDGQKFDWSLWLDRLLVAAVQMHEAKDREPKLVEQIVEQIAKFIEGYGSSAVTEPLAKVIRERFAGG